VINLFFFISEIKNNCELTIVQFNFTVTMLPPPAHHHHSHRRRGGGGDGRQQVPHPIINRRQNTHTFTVQVWFNKDLTND
jgi:hypothetical protein